MRADTSPPVLVAWSVGSTSGCGCVDLTVEVQSSATTNLHVEWGTTQTLGSRTDDVELYETSGSTPETLRWSPAPPAGSYYIELVASNAAGTTRSPLLGMTIDASGAVSTFVPPGPRPTNPHPNVPYTVATVAPQDPAVVVVGDWINYRVTLWASPYWPATSSLRLSIVLPGNQSVTNPAADPAFDVGSITSSAGSCVSGVQCDFGALGAGAEPYVVLGLRAKLPGSYQMVVRPFAGATVTVPITVVPRSADLRLQLPRPAALKLAVSKHRSLRVTITNAGPNVVSDAAVTVGAPRGLTVSAAVGGAGCTPVPIRCALSALAPGQSVAVKLDVTARRPEKVGVPIGVKSLAAADPDPANNTGRVVVTAAPQP